MLTLASGAPAFSQRPVQRLPLRQALGMLFRALADAVLEGSEVRSALDELVARKQAGDEFATAPPVPVLSRFVELELPRLEALREHDDHPGDVEELNKFFRSYALAA